MKYKAKPNKFFFTWTLLIISLALNVIMFNEMNFRTLAADAALARATAQNWAIDYCKISKGMTDGEIENSLRKIHPLEKAVIEQYEGKKSLYISHKERGRFSQWWADERYLIEECNQES